MPGIGLLNEWEMEGPLNLQKKATSTRCAIMGAEPWACSWGSSYSQVLKGSLQVRDCFAERPTHVSACSYTYAMHV